MSDSGEDGFLSRLRASPNDEEARVVYADWLEEQGRSAEGQFLRLQLTLATLAPDDPRFNEVSASLRDVAQHVTLEWRTLVARAPIENCEVRFDFACPKKWEGLEPTDLGDDVRFCGSCKMNVYYTRTVDDASKHATQGHCVVVDLVQIRRPFDLRSPIDGPRPPPPILMAGMPLPAVRPKLPPPEPPEPPEKAGPVRSMLRRLWPFGER